MARSKDMEEKFRRMEEEIIDLQMCLAGNPASARWQKINIEVANLKNTVTALKEKMINIIPQETRNYDKSTWLKNW